MIIYRTTTKGFAKEVLYDTLTETLESAFIRTVGHSVSPQEVAAWRHSLNAMEKVIRRSELPEDVGVAIEYTVPQTAKRIDLILSGYDSQNNPNLVVVELKQWSTSEVSDLEGVILAQRGGRTGMIPGPHPSYQAWSYVKLLEDFNENVEAERLKLFPCAYLHNHPVEGAAIRDARYDSILDKAPAYLKGPKEQEKLGTFLTRHIHKGDGGRLIEVLENGRLRPSKALADVIANILKGKEEFVLVDEQKVAFETIRQAVKTALDSPSSGKQVIIVRGGPGTGKSVIAINLLARFISEQLMAAYVTKNAAPRAVFQEKLADGTMSKARIQHLFNGSGHFVDVQDKYDVLLSDESHRLNEKSGLYRNLGENQVLEIIRAAKVSVFFIDEKQRVTFQDIGSEAEILKWAEQCHATVSYCELKSQFRCAGSNDYLTWVDRVLGLDDDDGSTLETTMDVQVFDSATEMHEAIRAKDAAGHKARVVAGYCWKWVSKKDKTQKDIVLDDARYAKQWNLAETSQLWAMKGGIDEVGCIHTCQGLEFDYVGVIIGPDVFCQDAGLATDAKKRASTDKSLNGWKTMLKTDPVRVGERVDEIIRNTYRTLLTRGMKGCYLYSPDPQVRAFLRQRLARLQHSI